MMNRLALAVLVMALAGCVTTETEIETTSGDSASVANEATVSTATLLPPSAEERAAALTAISTYTFYADRAPLQVVEDQVTASLRDEAAARAMAEELTAFLHTGATYDAKDFACRQLARIGNGDNAESIGVLLLDPKTSDIARYALQPIPGVQVDAVLIDALAQTSGTTRIGIINTLGERGCNKAKAELQALAQDPDAATAEAAKAALGKLGA